MNSEVYNCFIEYLEYHNVDIPDYKSMNEYLNSLVNEKDTLNSLANGVITKNEFCLLLMSYAQSKYILNKNQKPNFDEKKIEKIILAKLMKIGESIGFNNFFK